MFDNDSSSSTSEDFTHSRGRSESKKSKARSGGRTLLIRFKAMRKACVARRASEGVERSDETRGVTKSDECGLWGSSVVCRRGGLGAVGGGRGGGVRQKLGAGGRGAERWHGVTGWLSGRGLVTNEEMRDAVVEAGGRNSGVAVGRGW